MKTFAEFQIIGRVGNVTAAGPTLKVSIAADYGRKNDKGEWEIVDIFPHDLEVTPVVRFPCFLDSEGRVSGLVEHLIPGQDRVNQSVLDLLTGPDEALVGEVQGLDRLGQDVLDLPAMLPFDRLRDL